uniref:Uncharacterized protein n=1 Tax=Ascaris lumbricoides TaxID=6252 RepID=A0A9J2NZ83_ASCLU
MRTKQPSLPTMNYDGVAADTYNSEPRERWRAAASRESRAQVIETVVRSTGTVFGINGRAAGHMLTIQQQL